MPIPVINYAAMEPQGNPMLEGLIPAILQGLQMGYAPSVLKEQLEAQRLKNQSSKIENQYAPQMSEADIAYKQAQVPHLNAQTGFLNQQSQYYAPNILADILYKNNQGKASQFAIDNPLLNSAGPAGQIGAAIYLKNHPELMSGPMGSGTPNSKTDLQPMEDMSQSILDAMKAEVDRKRSFADFYGQRSEGFKFNSLPLDERKYLIAQATSMGYDPIDAEEKYFQGYTIEDLAKDKGIDTKNIPSPQYRPTGTTVTRLQQREQLLSEINVLDEKVSNAITPYSRRFNGYSPKQIIEAISNKNVDKQAEYLAARALYPELVSMRVRLMQGTVGIEALREITESSMGNISAYASLTSPEVYAKTNENIIKWLSDAANAANKKANPSASDIKNEALKKALTISDKDKEALVESGVATKANMVKLGSPDGQIFYVPEDKVDAAFKKYPNLQRED